jgi:hypothetical protein
LEDGSTYKPDFFIFNDNKLIRIVEVKAEDCIYYKIGLSKVQKLRNQLTIPVDIISIKELRKMCRQRKLSFDKLSLEWKQNDNSSKIKDINGDKNPMYGRFQSKESKIKNGLKTKQRFENDSDFRNLHSESVKNAMKSVDKEKLKYNNRNKNNICKCIMCNSNYISYTKQSIFCDKCRENTTKWQRDIFSKNNHYSIKYMPSLHNDKV